MYGARVAERLLMNGPHGRALDVECSGPSEGEVVLYHKGTPDSGSMFSPLVAAGAEQGLRHVTYSRPGYGRSARQEGRTVADCVADVTAILDDLGVDRFFTVGLSGGGPHALACAALLPERVLAAATIASVAPWGAEGLDWLGGMGKENLDEFGAALAGEAQLREYLEREGPGLAELSGEQLIAALGDLVSDVDRQTLSGEFGEHLAGCLREGLVNGIWGWCDDDIAFLADWGFELPGIQVPVTIWQGAQDRMVPSAHGRWLAEHTGGARAQLRPEHGHLSLAVGAYREILGDLLARAAR